MQEVIIFLAGCAKTTGGKIYHMSSSKKMSQIQQKLGGGRKLTEISNKMDKLIYGLVSDLKVKLKNEFKIKILHEKNIKLKYIVEGLRKKFPKENEIISLIHHQWNLMVVYYLLLIIKITNIPF